MYLFGGQLAEGERNGGLEPLIEDMQPAVTTAGFSFTHLLMQKPPPILGAVSAVQSHLASE